MLHRPARALGFAALPLTYRPDALLEELRVRIARYRLCEWGVCVGYQWALCLNLEVVAALTRSARDVRAVCAASLEYRDPAEGVLAMRANEVVWFARPLCLGSQAIQLRAREWLA